MNRRKLLGGVGAAGAALTTVGAVAQPAPAATPDAALTAAVNRYTTARAAYDACNPDGDGLATEEALGDACCASLSPVRDAPATTLAGLIAKARVAKRELAINLDGSEAPANYAGGALARSIVNDLLRIAEAGA